MESTNNEIVTSIEFASKRKPWFATSEGDSCGIYEINDESGALKKLFTFKTDKSSDSPA